MTIINQTGPRQLKSQRAILVLFTFVKTQRSHRITVPVLQSKRTLITFRYVRYILRYLLLLNNGLRAMRSLLLYNM